jgi:hypothetical protein
MQETLSDTFTPDQRMSTTLIGVLLRKTNSHRGRTGNLTPLYLLVFLLAANHKDTEQCFAMTAAAQGCGLKRMDWGFARIEVNIELDQR